jgi:hypothetical protein
VLFQKSLHPLDDFGRQADQFFYQTFNLATAYKIGIEPLLLGFNRYVGIIHYLRKCLAQNFDSVRWNSRRPEERATEIVGREKHSD